MQELLRDDVLPYAEFYLRPGSSDTYAIEWLGHLTNRWFAATEFAQNDTVRPRKATGYQYTVSSASGCSGAVEPAWPAQVGATVVDGSLTWTCEAADTQSLYATVTLSTWSADVGGVTVLGSSLGGVLNTRANVLVQAGNSLADGDYYVRNVVTLSNGTMPEGVLRFSVRNTKL